MLSVKMMMIRFAPKESTHGPMRGASYVNSASIALAMGPHAVMKECLIETLGSKYIDYRYIVHVYTVLAVLCVGHKVMYTYM